MNLLKEIRFRLGSARRARELHRRIGDLEKTSVALRRKLKSLENPQNEKHREEITNHFHRLYYNSSGQTWNNIRWMGARIMKTPLDLWTYQEIFHELEPDVLVEAGTSYGGSALYFAHLFDLMRKGRVVTVDVEEKEGYTVPAHDRITHLRGSSVAPEIVERMKTETEDAGCVVVILDSNHSRDHVLAELRAYAPLVTSGSYLIVEDTNINGHPVLPAFGPGPMEAVKDFLETDEGREFAPDSSREKHFLTFNPGGFLKKVGGRPGVDASV